MDGRDPNGMTMFDLYLNRVHNGPNMAINPAPFGRWTLRRGAAQRRLFLRYKIHEWRVSCINYFTIQGMQVGRRI